MAQQTAVEFLIESLPQIDWEDPFYIGLLQEAKAMEKKQIINSYRSAFRNNEIDISHNALNTISNYYYNETYGNQ